MELEKLNKYKIDASKIVSETDIKHIANYKQLIKFFESAISNSISDGKIDYNSLHTSTLQCIRFLDNLIFTYEAAINNARAQNELIDTIIKNNTSIKPQGNEKKY
jgi:hypothetical protein